MFNFMPGFKFPLELSGVTSEDVEIECNFLQSEEISIVISAGANQVDYSISYDESLFKEETIIKMAEQYEMILSQMSISKDLPAV